MSGDLVGHVTGLPVRLSQVTLRAMQRVRLFLQ